MREAIDKLNKNQMEAVEHSTGPLLVLAGAGSGKTRIITARISRLVRKNGIRPDNILAITFTNKAAGEMKNRLIKHLGDKTHQLWIGTFHAVCARILRANITILGGQKNFIILDDKEQIKLIKEIMAGEGDSGFLTPAQVKDQISKIKNKSWDFLAAHRMNDQEILPQVKIIMKKYNQLLWRRQTLDFDDLIVYTINLLEKFPDILEQYREQFQYILVDEYHDTNPLQYRFLKLLFQKHENIFVVGDADQNIYSWRGADIRNILEFEKDFPGTARIIRLEENYRSTKNILSAANQLIRHNRLRQEKNLWTSKETGSEIGYFEASDSEGEAEFIARQIKKIPGGDMAVFYRTHAQSRAIEEALLKARISYQIIGGVKFYARKEIKDILAYLRLLANPRDDLAFLRIVNTPARGLGKAAQEIFKNRARKNDLSLMEALEQIDKKQLSSQAARGRDRLLGLFRSLEKMLARDAGLTSLIREVIILSGYKQYITELPPEQAEEKKANVEELISVGENFEKQAGVQLIDFLSWVGLAGEEAALAPAGATPRVVLTTIHNAKGLEFQTVFIAGLEEGLLPHVRNMDNEFFLEEERRLFYVGITRAKNKLFISRARTRRLSGQELSGEPSRFLRELPEELIENMSPKYSSPESIEYAEAYPEVTVGNLNPGDIIEHSNWGRGRVIKIMPGKDIIYQVRFNKIGLKDLLAKYAPIKKIASDRGEINI